MLTTDNDAFTVSQVSETSLLITFHEQVGVDLSLYIADCGKAVNSHLADAVTNTIPSYNALLVTLRPSMKQNYSEKLKTILLSVPRRKKNGQKNIIEIPTWYDQKVAQYLDEITRETGCSLDELIKLHTREPFFVYMIGFCPGFAYMGDLPKQLRLPRRKVPQTRIPAGSVAIADFQTAVYPLAMPGGWHIIGRTPLTIFDTERDQPSLLQQGDMVQFKAISGEEYLQQGGVL